MQKTIVKKNSVLFFLLFSLLFSSLGGLVLLSGCQPQPAAPEKPEAEEKKQLKLVIAEVFQQSALQNKPADGQFVIAKLNLENLTNKTITINPKDIKLQNITDNPEEQYTQPSERGMSNPLGRLLGKDAKAKTLDFISLALYPRLSVERFAVFVLPFDADVANYQVIHTPTKTTAPLATIGKTVIHDNRNTN
ncbi:MAG: hypothetical protein AAGI66_05005 [Cyanobacteria bacterium P01_H01_bin.74]